MSGRERRPSASGWSGGTSRLVRTLTSVSLVRAVLVGCEDLNLGPLPYQHPDSIAMPTRPRRFPAWGTSGVAKLCAVGHPGPGLAIKVVRPWGVPLYSRASVPPQSRGRRAVGGGARRRSASWWTRPDPTRWSWRRCGSCCRGAPTTSARWHRRCRSRRASCAAAALAAAVAIGLVAGLSGRLAAA